jgi:uncharacterized small protein (DUF1192 family)
VVSAPNIGLVAMPPEQYHADPCAVPSLNYSTAYALVAKSPAHAYLQHPRLGGKSLLPTAPMDEGSLFHEIILRGVDSLKERIVVVVADDWRTKAAKAQRDEAREAGKLPVLEKNLIPALTACVEILAQFRELGIVLSGASEVAAFWQEHASDGTVVQCRGMFDHVLRGDGIIYDLKKSRTAHPKAIRKHVEGYGYHIQAAAYTRALERIEPRLQGKVQFRWLFVEAEAPYGVTMAEPAGSMRRLGEACWSQAVDQWAHCTAVNDWPAYPREVVRVEASPWALEGAFTDDEGEVAA